MTEPVCFGEWDKCPYTEVPKRKRMSVCPRYARACCEKFHQLGSKTEET